MDDKMKKEILDSWNSWKYDIQDMNKSEWNTRDQSKLDMITVILEEQLKLKKAILRKDFYSEISIMKNTNVNALAPAVQK